MKNIWMQMKPVTIFMPCNSIFIVMAFKTVGLVGEVKPMFLKMLYDIGTGYTIPRFVCELKCT